MGEVRDPKWPPAALRTQAIAARTYAMRAMAAGGEICDTQRCQAGKLGQKYQVRAIESAIVEMTSGSVAGGKNLLHRACVGVGIHGERGIDGPKRRFLPDLARNSGGFAQIHQHDAPTQSRRGQFARAFEIPGQTFLRKRAARLKPSRLQQLARMRPEGSQ